MKSIKTLYQEQVLDSAIDRINAMLAECEEIQKQNERILQDIACAKEEGDLPRYEIRGYM